MLQNRLRPWRKAAALLPLTVLSGTLPAGLGTIVTAPVNSTEDPAPPGGITMPEAPLEAPASVSRLGSVAEVARGVAAGSMVESASVDGIPAAALAAYQRAAEVLSSADPGCNLSWELLAAIGRVESDHGRYGGNLLGEDGTSRPGVVGVPLDGGNGTARIFDTDAGELDGDAVFDRAVGPMQFIPSTWSVVGVDGDGDGVRNPQDIDDAALASAVYLCSGEEDLATEAGQRAAVYRYNSSEEYVDLVIALMDAYQEGWYTSMPNGVAAPIILAAADEADLGDASARERGKQSRDGRGPSDRPRTSGDRGKVAGAKATDAAGPSSTTNTTATYDSPRAGTAGVDGTPRTPSGGTQTTATTSAGTSQTTTTSDGAQQTTTTTTGGGTQQTTTTTTGGSGTQDSGSGSTQESPPPPSGDGGGGTTSDPVQQVTEPVQDVIEPVQDVIEPVQDVIEPVQDVIEVTETLTTQTSTVSAETTPASSLAG